MKESKGRIPLLDVLRGFAIMGTLGTNIWMFAHLGNVDYLFTYAHNEWWASFDVLIRYIALFFVNGKLLGLLTILFGAGLALQYDKAQRLRTRWPGPYLLTALFLMLEGFLHYAFVMEYDILMSYALTAILVAWIVKGGARAIKISMWTAGIVHGLLMALLFLSSLSLYVNGDSLAADGALMTDAVYRSGTWLEQIQFRLANFLLFRREAILVLPLNIVLFLAGFRLMRAGAFHPDEKGRLIRRRMLRLGLGLGIPLNLLMFVPGGLFDFPLRYVFAPILSIGYIAVLARLSERFGRWAIWPMLGRVGKMALSCYILQNLLASVVFYGWGFGLGGALHSAGTVAAWLAICVILVVFAKIWLHVFKIGPMEAVRKSVVGLLDRKEKKRDSNSIST
ncbi:DUF418 domain-containing protein [Paenibacillus methanolicus]|uniref:DUF418 domain-containing protein n=1 Tax=Paenibacillus methanolicus TaxID=582686 RepID=A0A5S5CH90_9BACL|nr:DUF418 domain-containing protein [Paenibacillus methanolicus]TYP79156.1 uncharacterized protein BCM02_101272 [Paenibacillus methanolicus]